MQLLQGDCLAHLQGVCTGTIDAIITDPPYMATDLKFDVKGFDVDAFKREAYRVLKPNGYLVSFGVIPLFAKLLDPFVIRFSGVWIKPAPTLRTATAKKPMSKHEPYIVCVKDSYKVSELTFNKHKIYGFENYKVKITKSAYKRGGTDSLDRTNTQGWTTDGHVAEVEDGSRWQTDVIEAPNKNRLPRHERTEHPTQKPVSLMETLVKWLTNEGDVVLDPFMGSGTTGVACKNLNRKFIGIELQENYFAIAQQRLGLDALISTTAQSTFLEEQFSAPKQLELWKI